MKKLCWFLMFLVVLIAPLMGSQNQDEIVLRQLGRAPLSPYLQSPEEIRNLLKRVNEEVGKALEWFPGGALGEAVYVELYSQLDSLKMELVQVPAGQRFIWMLYSKGRMLKGLRWEGSELFQAYKFNVQTEGKIFTFVVPVRCGNISLMEIREAPPVVSASPVSPVPAPAAPQAQPQNPPAPVPVKPVTPISTPTVHHFWSPTIKIKVGGGWGRIQTLPNVDTQTPRLDFFSLIPAGDTVGWCEDGTAMWYYTTSDHVPFAVGQQIPLWNHSVEKVEKKNIAPLYVELELELWKNVFLAGSFFQLGKYSSYQYSGKESMVIDELRLLGSYNSSADIIACCPPPPNVYYIGLHREWEELLVRDEVKIHEWTASLKYQFKLYRKLNLEAEAGMLWQVKRGRRITDTSFTKLYPFKEEALEREKLEEEVEKIKEVFSTPYVGAVLEVGPLFVQARRLLKQNDTLIKISPWRLQGGILLKI